MTDRSKETLSLENGILTEKKTPDGRTIEFEAIQSLLKFLTESDMDVPYTFCCDPGIGESYVQRMRTELSRLRNKVKNMKRQPKEFKMLLVGVKSFETHDEITLKRSVTRTQEMTSILRGLIGILSEDQK